MPSFLFIPSFLYFWMHFLKIRIMKISYILILSVIFLFSCSGNQEIQETGNSIPPEVLKQVLEIATDYAKSQLKDSVKTMTRDGITWISDKQMMYEIDPARIYTGLIDEDLNEDAIITLAIFQGQNMKIPKHLIIIKSGNSLKLAKAIESQMRILLINNKKIIAEISSMAKDSPQSDCNLCKDTVDFQFNGVELFEIKK